MLWQSVASKPERHTSLGGHGSCFGSRTMDDAHPMRVGLYHVTVFYREPTYELFVGKKADPYYWKYLIAACSEDAAKAEALRQFEEIARLSGVGWVRRVVRVETSPASAAVARRSA